MSAFADPLAWVITILFASACTAIGWRLRRVFDHAGDRLAAIQEEFRPPAAGTPAPPPAGGSAPAAPLPGSALGQAASPPPAPGNDPYGRWLKSIDVFENATVVTDWQAETHEVFPASFDPGPTP